MLLHAARWGGDPRTHPAQLWCWVWVLVRDKSDPQLTSMLGTGFLPVLHLPGWECKHHETRRRPQPAAVGSHMAQLQKYFSLDQKGTIIAEYIW